MAKKVQTRAISRDFLKSAIRRDLDSVAMLSKLVAEPNREEDKENNIDKKDPNESRFAHDELSATYFNTSAANANRFQRSKDILRLFPDLEFAAGIYKSAVVSSGDLATTILKYTFKDPRISPAIMAKAVELVSTSVSENYTIVKDIPDIVEQILIGKGSVTRVVLPENSLDEMINGRKEPDISLESCSEVYSNSDTIKPLGILGSPDRTRTAMESEDIVDFFANRKNPYSAAIGKTGIEIIDNYNVLKMPALRTRIEQHALEDSIYSTPEFDGDSNDTPYKDDTGLRRGEVFKSMDNFKEDAVYIKTDEELNRESVAAPNVFVIPAESVIPVIRPGRPDVQHGIFVPLDENHNFISVDTKISPNERKTEEDLQNGRVSSTKLSDLYSKLENPESTEREVTDSDKVLERFKSVVERELLERLTNGLYRDGSVSIGGSTDVSYMMLLRTLNAKRTRLLYIPAQLATYYAFKYDSDGVGLSVLDGICELSSMRASLLYSEVSAGIRRNIRSTNVELTLDPRDPNPEKSIAIATNEILKTNQRDLAYNLTSPKDLSDWVQRAGYSVSYKNHPGLPQVGFEFNDVTNTRANEGDLTLTNSLREQQYNSFGVTSEMVDGGVDIRYATTDSNNRKLFHQRTKRDREALTAPISNEVRGVVRADPKIFKALADILAEDPSFKGLSKSERTLRWKEFINSLTVSIADNSEDVVFKAAQESYNDYKTAVEDALQAWVGKDLMGSYWTNDDTSDVMGDLAEVVKASLLRKFQASRGYMSELSGVLSMKDDVEGLPSMKDDIAQHVKMLTETLGVTLAPTKKPIVDFLKKKSKFDAALDVVGEDEDEDDNTEEDTTDGDNPADAEYDDGLDEDGDNDDADDNDDGEADDGDDDSDQTPADKDFNDGLG